jgi:hypothetical protein
MRQKINAIDDNVDEESCHHFWIIEVANGPKSRGKCKYCGEVRDFQNSITNLNDPRRRSNPLNLPKMSKVKLDNGSKS